MKIYIKSFFLFLTFLGSNPYCFSQTKAPTPPPIQHEDFFVKIGAGSFFSENFYTSYNRPNINGISNQVNETVPGFSDLIGSAEVGMDFPDRFTLSVSEEGLPQDWSTMINIQKEFPYLSFWKPYLFFGLGFDFQNSTAIGPCAQFGIGRNFEVSSEMDLFVETKVYVSNVYLTNVFDIPHSYVAWDIYVPVLAGIKYKL